MAKRLAQLTSLRLGGPAESVVEVATSDELVAAVLDADAAGRPLLLVGGGSNLVVSDDGWPGVVILVRTRGIAIQPSDDHVAITLAAGEPWDDVVAMSMGEGWSGLASMSGIPGLAGATPVQNVGAYGSEIADVLSRATVLDRLTGQIETWTGDRCGFGFRTSAFKHTDRYVVLDVTLTLRRSELSGPVRYLELARRLGIEPGELAPSPRVREVVLELRASKGMLLDDSDHDTWSVGSFFVNPVVPAELVPAGCPHWTVTPATPTGADELKLSAAWLIERAGFARGYGHGPVGVSSKHTLALVNRGGATTAQLLELAAEIRDGVEARFGIRLRPEARLVGATL